MLNHTAAQNALAAFLMGDYVQPVQSEVTATVQPAVTQPVQRAKRANLQDIIAACEELETHDAQAGALVMTEW
ncbi:hypothetical protein [Methyloversatilis sp.]|uniref:hypothetical protein n=1 Tax=Methyloversatilis sp. TaxID=2569862 RepID=UPI0035B28728